MAKLCAAAAGVADAVEIVLNDPAAAGVDAKKAFPFRNMVLVTTEISDQLVPSRNY